MITHKPTRKERGFTLIELLVVISIIAILTTIGIVSFQGAQRSARDAKRKNDLKVVQYALVSYSQDNGGIFPAKTGTNEVTNYTQMTTSDSPSLQSAGYLPSVPTDPRNNVTGGYQYKYRTATGGTTFTLRTCLENTNEPSGGNVRTVLASTCTSLRELFVTNP